MYCSLPYREKEGTRWLMFRSKSTRRGPTLSCVHSSNIYRVNLVFFNWNIIALQCVSFCCTMKWISYKYTYIPPSWASLPPTRSPSHPYESSQSTELIFLFYSRFPLAFSFTPDSVARMWKPPKCPTDECEPMFCLFFFLLILKMQILCPSCGTILSIKWAAA